ncbi:MAG TPA: hypothetical protein VF743_12420, partial [Acidimicrobiales bacterium]
LVAFGRFLDDGAEVQARAGRGDVAGALALYRQSPAFTDLTAALDEAQALDQATFDEHATAAADATDGLDLAAGAAAVVVAGLAVLGLRRRLREYAA